MKLRGPAVIHVNRNVLAANKKRGRRDPAITVRQGRRVRRVHHLELWDADGRLVATVVQDELHPLACGARVWVEAEPTTRLHLHRHGRCGHP